ncbi:MAG TPA: metalloregulator ArsR/SmtB family transcription factor [Stellaceae bacterium]|nr:metalloregulator ArsR/SmtB family transcription factor [Stellaceae bacterium]
MERKAIVTALGALAQETRLAVYRLLVQAGPAGMPAGRIAERLQLALPTLSFHLAQLKQARLVTARRESRSIIYAASYPAMNGLIAYLTENCCGGDSAQCGIADNRTSEKGAASHEAVSRSRRR